MDDNFPVRVSFGNDAVYVELLPGRVCHSEQVHPATVRVDYDSEGKLSGIMIIGEIPKETP